MARVAFLWELLKLNTKYLFRSRTVLAVLIFSTVCQGLGGKILRTAQISFQGVMIYISDREMALVALFIQLFCGAFLTIVYGIWGMPYLHRHPRADLTYVLPIPRWGYPVGYALALLVPLCIQYLVIFVIFGFQFGWGTFFATQFPWVQFVSAIAVQILAFEMMLFCFGFLTVVIGQVPTLFFGTLLFVILQSFGAVIRTSFWKLTAPQFETMSRAETLYRFFPPMGELAFAIRAIFSREGWNIKDLGSWVFWLMVFSTAFWWCLRRPLRPRVTE